MSSRLFIATLPNVRQLRCLVTLTMSHGKQFTLFTHVFGPNGW